jgi:WD40 repeat protein
MGIVWDVSSGARLYSIPHVAVHITAPTMAPDGQLFAWRVDQHNIHLFHTETGIPHSIIYAGSGGRPMAFSPDSQLFAWVLRHNWISIRDVKGTAVRVTSSCESQKAVEINFSVDGQVFVSSAIGGSLHVYARSRQTFCCVLTTDLGKIQ